MSAEPLLPFHLYDDDADVSIIQRRLPHWSQPGTIVFITFRAGDSMPKAVLDEWFEERARCLLQHGVDPKAPDWRKRLEQIDLRLARSLLDRLWNRWHDALDAGHGDCVLRDRDCSAIVAEACAISTAIITCCSTSS